MPARTRHFFSSIENPSMFRLMAYSTDSLINLVYGNVSKYTFYLMNSQHIARAKSQSVRNPRTVIQQSNRDNIKPLLNYFRQLKPILYLSLNDRQENQTAYNKFMSINLNKSIKNGMFIPGKFMMASETFSKTKFEVLRQIGTHDNFMITWSDDSNKQKLSSDKLLCVYYDIYSNAFQYSITSKSRSDLAVSVSFKLSLLQPHIMIYLFFVRSDYSKSSRMEIIEFS